MIYVDWRQVIGAVAFALNVWGNLELTKQTNRGHIIRRTGDTSSGCPPTSFWIIYSPLIGAWALLLNHITFGGINILGFIRWKKIEARREGDRCDCEIADGKVTSCCAIHAAMVCSELDRMRAEMSDA
jgi:hypothetical protein